MSDRNKEVGGKIRAVVKNKTRARRRIPENIAAVAKSVEKIQVCPVSITQTSFHCILHKDLGLEAYKVQLTQELKPADYQQRRFFDDWVVEMHENDPEFNQKPS